jgi:hypothetical protein
MLRIGMSVSISHVRAAALQERIIAALDDKPVASLAALANRIGAKHPSVSRAMHALKSCGLVAQEGRSWALTDDGAARARAIAAESPKRVGRALDQLEKALVHHTAVRFQTPEVLRDIESTSATAAQIGRHHSEQENAITRMAGFAWADSAPLRALDAQFDSTAKLLTMQQSPALDALRGLDAQFNGIAAMMSAAQLRAFDRLTAIDFSPRAIVPDELTGIQAALQGIVSLQRHQITALQLEAAAPMTRLQELIAAITVPTSQMLADLAAFDGARLLHDSWVDQMAQSAADVALAHRLLAETALADVLASPYSASHFDWVSASVAVPAFTAAHYIGAARETALPVLQRAKLATDPERAETYIDVFEPLGPRFVTMWRGA